MNFSIFFSKIRIEQINVVPPSYNALTSARLLPQANKIFEAWFKCYIDQSNFPWPLHPEVISHFFELQIHSMCHFNSQIFNPISRNSLVSYDLCISSRR